MFAKYTISLLLLALSAIAYADPPCPCQGDGGDGYYFSDIRVYFPNGRVSFYWGCNVVYFDGYNPAELDANCLFHAENVSGTNPLHTDQGEPMRLTVFGVTPGVSPWYRVDHVDGTGACDFVGTYAVPFGNLGALGYVVRCDGDDLIFGDNFEGQMGAPL